MNFVYDPRPAMAKWPTQGPQEPKASTSMKDLIEALTILAKYGNPSSPTHCEHDVLTVVIDPKLVTKDDADNLYRLGFYPGRGDNAHCFYSHRFGSA